MVRVGMCTGRAVERDGDWVADAVLVHRAVRAGRRPGELPVDPVCRMTIAANASAGRLVHEGVEHHFCSLECAGKFAADPGRYLA